MHLSLPKTD